MASGKLTALQKELQRSRRLLAKRTPQAGKADTSAVPPTSSLHRHIRQRNLPHIEPPTSAPFSQATERELSHHTDDQFANLAASRISHLRRTATADTSAPVGDERSVPLDTPAWLLSTVSEVTDSPPGIPVWREVLETQRAHPRPSSEARQEHAQMTGREVPRESPLELTEYEIRSSMPKWPRIFTPNDLNTWENWETGPENRLATTAAREVIIHPATRSNPLLIIGPAGVGKTHLLQAIAESIHHRHPDGVVRLVNAVEFANRLPVNWVTALHGCNALIVDGLSQPIDGESLVQMGELLDLALDLGVQVVAAGESLPPEVGRLARVLKSAVVVEVSPPERMTLLVHLRNLALKRMLSLSDEQLAAIVDHSGENWRSVQAAFEKVAVSLEAGAEPIGSEDITDILSGAELPMRDDDGLIGWDSEETGRRIVSEVLEDILPRERQPNVDYVSEMESVADDYRPPNLMPDSGSDAVDSLLARHLGREKDSVEEARSRVAEAARPTELEAPDRDNYKIDVMGEAFLDRLESRLRRHQDELFSLHNEMEHISHNLDGAGTKELVDMADRMMEIDRSLSRISRLESGESLKARVKPPRPYEPPVIEEPAPLSEWEVDVGLKDASDQLEADFTTLRPVTILNAEVETRGPFLKPITTLVPASSED